MPVRYYAIEGKPIRLTRSDAILRSYRATAYIFDINRKSLIFIKMLQIVRIVRLFTT